MTPKIRLALVGGILVMSAAYAVLVEKDPGVAAAVASGYVAILLTIFFLLNTWKKP
jgi:hypothetical protein